jgi:hypothetical protein
MGAIRYRVSAERTGSRLECSLNTVRDLLGHSSVQLSLRYAHLAPGQRREAVAKLNEKPVLALTMHLPWNGFQNAASYAFDFNGGKGGNRTLDPGIMRGPLLREITRTADGGGPPPSVYVAGLPLSCLDFTGPSSSAIKEFARGTKRSDLTGHPQP